MNGAERVGPLLAHIRAEHREMHRQVDELRRTLARRENCRTLGECRNLYHDRLVELRRRLVEHFAEEENGGCIEEALSSAPHLAAEATDLEREHQDLLRALDVILARLAVPPKEETWRQCVAEFESFAKSLLSHEARENRLLQRGFNVDLGLDDQ